jgi:hypothetical protein
MASSRTDDPFAHLNIEYESVVSIKSKNRQKTESPPAQGALMTMPSPPAYRPLSLVLITIFLTLCCLLNSTHAAFDEAACLSCVGIDDSLNATDFASASAVVSSRILYMMAHFLSVPFIKSSI